MSAANDRSDRPALLNAPRRSAGRRLTIADAMILVAATAVGLAGVQALVPSMPRWGTRTIQVVRWFLGPPSCVAMAGMASLLILRLKRPRPSWRRLTRQPGCVAAIAALVGLLPGAVWNLVLFRFRQRARSWSSFADWWMLLIDFVPTVVVGAWLALALSGRWRSEPDWIDRVCRLLALYWILCFVVKELYRVAMQLVLLVP